MVLIVPGYTQSSYQIKDNWTATVQYAMMKKVKQYRECAKLRNSHRFQQRCWRMTATALHKGAFMMKPRTSKERAVRPHGLPHLRYLRQRKGLSLGQLADMTGIRRDTIAHLESGCEDPLPYQVRLLARVLEVPQPDLVS
jgi:DNA-binding XRE family transcriptional regulator